MSIIVGKTSGFCRGVKSTVERLNKILEENSDVYALGDVVHNESVVDYFKKKGLIVVDDISNVPDNSNLIIRAHGQRKEIYNICQKRNIKVFDLTCGKILAIRQKVINHSEYFIFIMGKKNHPEVLSTSSFIENYFIIENEDDLEMAFKSYENSNINKLYIVSQTTFNTEKFNELVSIISKKYKNAVIDNTICNATEERQKETSSLSKMVDTMIIIGGKNSSNTKELYNIAQKYNDNVILISNEEELDTSLLKGSIGIMAGASTPQNLIDNVIKKIKG